MSKNVNADQENISMCTLQFTLNQDDEEFIRKSQEDQLPNFWDKFFGQTKPK